MVYLYFALALLSFQFGEFHVSNLGHTCLVGPYAQVEYVSRTGDFQSVGSHTVVIPQDVTRQVTVHIASGQLSLISYHHPIHLSFLH